MVSVEKKSMKGKMRRSYRMEKLTYAGKQFGKVGTAGNPTSANIKIQLKCHPIVTFTMVTGNSPYLLVRWTGGHEGSFSSLIVGFVFREYNSFSVHTK